MVGASKILTVSYGTFSCTLEGFDEPFSTMKAIAEYFRDLAADDRYFGATPPTPDAEMLHRIAEREIQRRVEAKISDQGIVLRPEPLEHAPAAVPAPMPAAAAMTEERAKPSIPESVAQKLMRIRAAVSEENKAEAPQAPVRSESAVPFEEDEATDEFAAAAVAPAIDFGFELDLGDMPGLKTALSTDEAASAEAEAEDTIASILADATASGESDADTVDEVLADEILADRAPAEEAAHAADLAESALTTDEEIAAVEVEAELAEIAEPQDDEEGIVAFDATEDFDDAEPVEEAEAALLSRDEEDLADEGETLDLAAFRDAAELAIGDEAEDAAEDEAELVAEDMGADEEEDEDERPRARIIRMSRTADEDDEDDEDLSEEDAAAFDLPEDAPVEDRTAAVMAALSERAYDDEDFDEAADATDTEAGDKDILAQIGAAIGSTGLPDEEEEELLRDLADVSRDLRRDGHEGRAILESASEDDEASVARLMEEAKSKLEGPENRRRFSAIAHLKAAVAATVADRKMKSGDAGVVSREVPGDDTERYRDDLSKAVRPRRPTSDSIPVTQRPTLSTRMAPLVLVSEQRVDMAEGTRHDAAVVRPRRIRAAVLDTVEDEDMAEDTDTPVNPEDARSFAEFAERLGASSLPDLLEAAAAYTATVEGIPYFSRPQIIKKVAGMAEDEDYSQEDSLRSFGMLLRQGKIQKVRGGQFMLSEASRFMDEARRVGQ
jgi:hypothetical protein